MNDVLKRLKEVKAEACVTIIMNTHRTRPDNEKDPITLKNLVKTAEERLYKTYDKRFVWPIVDKLNKITSKIDHQQNLESLLIFVNRDVAEYTRLAVQVKDRVIIDNTFATRDIVRALHQETGYYVLVLSRQNARLIEAFNDKVVKEFQGSWPIKNDLYSTSRFDLTTNKGTDNLIEEFFNRVDKIVQDQIKKNPLPLIIATETRNFNYYKKVADNKDPIIGHINKNRDDEKAHHIVSDAWEQVQKIFKEKQEKRIVELHAAVKSGKYLSDINDIWHAIKEGRGKTLFVKKGYFQSAKIDGDKIVVADSFDKHDKDVIDDIVDEMIEMNLAFGGDAAFLTSEEMEKFRHLALITRY